MQSITTAPRRGRNVRDLHERNDLPGAVGPNLPIVCLASGIGGLA